MTTNQTTELKATIPSTGLHSASVSIDGVSKTFGDVSALSDVTLSVQSGEIRGLLGPNGSGKSTLMKIMLGLIRPDRGSALVEGINPLSDPVSVHQLIGYVPDTPKLYDYLTGVEYLDFVADLYKIPPSIKKERIDEYLTALELKDRGNEQISGYSLGMKQKIAFGAALLHKPKVLILDEVLNGLDPKSARIVKDTLVKLASTGVTVIFSTHILEIAQAICPKVTILDQGKVLAEGTMDDLKVMEGRSLQKGGSPNDLEAIFLSLTGSSDVRATVDELTA